MVLRKCEAKQPNYQGNTESYFLLATGSTSRRATQALKQMIVTITNLDDGRHWRPQVTVNHCLRERGSNPWSSTKTCCLINSYSDPEDRSGVIATGGSEA